MDVFKRSVVFKSIICLVPVVVLAISLVYTVGSHRDAVGKRNMLLNAIFGLRARIVDLHDREAILAANLGLYKKVLFLKIKQDSYMSDINNIVNALVKKHMLIQPKIQISAPKEAKFDSYNEGDSLSAITGTVSIDFFSISDINVFSFVNSMRQSIPGYVLVKDLKLVRSGNLDTKTILDYASQDASSEVVKGSITFEWYGLESIGVEN